MEANQQSIIRPILYNLTLIIICFSSFELNAQDSNFYYFFDKKIVIQKVPNKYFLEFPIDSLQPQNELGIKIAPKVFSVTDTSNLVNLGIPYRVTPTFSYMGEEINYLNKVVLRFKENIDNTTKQNLINSYNLSFIKSTPSYDLYAVLTDALNTANLLYETGLLEFCHPDFWVIVKKTAYIPNDAYFAKQWYLHNTAQGTNDGKTTTFDADIDAPEAWDITKGNSSIAIAVIDEGVTSNHPDLPNTRQLRYINSNYAASVDGTSPNDPSPPISTTLGNNHGNACAGIVAATQNNNEGITGIAPLCKILPVRVPVGITAPTSLYADAIDFANGKSEVKILSISWGLKTPIISIQLAIKNSIIANKVVAIGAGNNANHSISNPGFTLFPGNVFIDEVITVAASDRNNKRANYSPNGDEIELAAPSHTAYNFQIPGEAYNIWTIDIPGTNYGYNPWRDIGDHPLPSIGEYLPLSGTNYHAYTGRMGGTSAATPQVAGVAALMLSVNPCMNVKQVKDILQSTADKIGGYDYDWNKYLAGHPKEHGYSKELGYGKINAYRAVKAAQEAASNTGDRLYLKDNTADIGITGVDGTGGGDKSPDIWVRNQPDGLLHWEHENPEFTAGSPVYVYVRVHNKSCDNFTPPLSPAPSLSLYWSKASSWASWPANWNGTTPSIGNLIASKTLPTISAGGSQIVEFTWTMLDPKVYKTWNSCLMARIEGLAGDPITIYPGRQDKDVKENNNVAMRNVTVVDIKPGAWRPFGGPVLVGNIEASARSYNIRFSIPEPKPNLSDEAEIKLHFDETGWQIFENAGAFGQNQQGIEVLPNRTILVKNSNIVLQNINFPANTRVPIEVGFNFLTKNYTNNTKYEWVLSQTYSDTPEHVLGSESYLISKVPRNLFYAHAGNDTTVNKGDTAILSANQILDSADYKWYDEFGVLLHTGLQYCISPQSNKKYTLEIVSLTDGYKDYDKVEVFVKPYYISNISPNPASTLVNIGYVATAANAGQIVLLTNNGTQYSTTNIDTHQNQVQINTSNYPPGIYTVVLVCEGQIADSKTLHIY